MPITKWLASRWHQRSNNLLRIEAGILRHEHRAQLEAAYVKAGEFEVVAQRDGDAVAFAHAEGLQAAGDAVALRVEGRVGEDGVSGGGR